MATTRRATSSVCNQVHVNNRSKSHLNRSFRILLLSTVWFKVKLHVKDAKTMLDKKKYVAFWLERYAKKEPGMPLTVIFDMTDSGLGNIVSPRQY